MLIPENFNESEVLLDMKISSDVAILDHISSSDRPLMEAVPEGGGRRLGVVVRSDLGARVVVLQFSDYTKMLVGFDELVIPAE